MVTGAARGIGAAIAERLCRAGHPVAIIDVHGESAQGTADALHREHGVPAIGVGADVADSKSVLSALSHIRTQLGPISILVNNAGVISVAPFLQVHESEWDRIMAINTKGQFLCAQAVLPDMLAQRWGRIINIASDAAKTAEPFIAHYSASKFAVIGLTQSIALEYAATGITANAVCPAITDTAMMEDLAKQLASATAESDRNTWRDGMVREIPLGRPMAPHDIAALCGYLVTDDAAAISGQAINVSGAHELH
ncbi:SDR family NAD(P)-dependent oxidoreductase [Mycolicibacterium frederiksbergense]|uniref:SDR family NAD(P)-dependent oxidoreductase n=1 Tax=Mycolicibacterium frederiksbergense TaxID=117567 RepID=UPI002476391B|nr:SDR family NAD(P)-dependent oxidoreductase [Mycolicibacterium frederiksbergense]